MDSLSDTAVEAFWDAAVYIIGGAAGGLVATYAFRGANSIAITVLTVSLLLLVFSVAFLARFTRPSEQENSQREHPELGKLAPVRGPEQDDDPAETESEESSGSSPVAEESSDERAPERAEKTTEAEPQHSEDGIEAESQRERN